MKQAKVLTDTELKRVLAICVTMQNGKRNRLMLLLSHYAGMRVGEIASLKWADVLDREMKPKAMFYLKAENTKAKEARQVHLNAKLQRELTTYWAQLDRWKKLERPVIESQKGGPFTANSMVQAFTRVFDAAGIDDASSHSGRRWFITRLAHSGISPKVIMELAGHKQLTTTQRYIDVSDEQIRKWVRGEDGEREQVTEKRPIRKWWWQHHTGAWMLTLTRHGSLSSGRKMTSKEPRLTRH